MREGGCGRYGVDLIAGLRALGAIEARVVSPRRRRDSTAAPFTPWGRRRVARLALTWKADLVHGLHLELPHCGIPSVVTIQDLIPLDHPASMPSRARRLVYERLLHSSLRRADRVIVPSEATASSLCRRGADPAKVAVIPLAVGPAFRPLGEAERVRARLRFAAGHRYVAAATGARAHKNLPGLARAAAELARGLGLAVVATGPPLDGGIGSIRFLGRLSDEELRSFYGGAEALVLASHVEGFGLPALEALACGTPVVSGAGIGALPYLGGGAVSVDVRSPSEIAAAIERVVSDEQLRSRLVAAGLASARRLTPVAMAQATAKVYEEVAHAA